MKKVSASRFLAVLTVTLLALSSGFGYRSYSKAERGVMSELNRALQQTVTKQSVLWFSQDTLQYCSKWQSLWGSPLSLNVANRHFTEALSTPQLKEASGILVHIAKTDGDTTSSKEELPTDYVISDTILWVSATEMKATSAQTPAPGNISLSFRGYARCPMTTILLISDQTLPLMLLSLALLSGIAAFRLSPTQEVSPPAITLTENRITVGNLSYCPDERSFYNRRQERLRLTPLQLSLMEMFYQTPSHLLTKTDIFKTLWPGKENADETLYTLIRRLKPIVEENSNLRITTDRGRAYGLEVES